jgi:hypothetical protein
MVRVLGALLITALLLSIGIGLVNGPGGTKDRSQKPHEPAKPAGIEPGPETDVAQNRRVPGPEPERDAPNRPRVVPQNPLVLRPEPPEPPARIKPDRPREAERDVAVAQRMPVVPIQVEYFSSHGSMAINTGFKITCLDSGPVQVKKVVYNDNFKVHLMILKTSYQNVSIIYFEDIKANLKFHIGEVIYAAWNLLAVYPDDPRTYSKEVIHLDVVTDRGTFRFNTAGDLLGFEPPTVEEKVLDEAEQRWDEARRAVSSKRSPLAGVYLRDKRREIITDLAKKYSLTEQQVREIVGR